MIIGTAGHIDHGKTTLVRALTGIDTDRLREEKARGISIELGYAYRALPDGDVLGIIDVPGHERFVRTMLAGACGVDFALLAVAANDGVMPQTREHVAILQLLGVTQGVVALTKIDRVSHARAERAEQEVRQLLGNTSLQGAPIFRVNATVPDDPGVASLLDYLQQQATHVVARNQKGFFRLAVDRVFTLQGVGTVATGTVFSGAIHAGETVRIMPSGREARVRSIHAQNRPAECGHAGQRCALNLTAVEPADLRRGDWLADRRALAPSGRMDVRAHLLAPAGAGSRRGPTRMPVHVHLGTAHVLAHLVSLKPDETPEGLRAQLVLERPLCAVAGDRFILRDAGARTTIGGGMVLDPYAPPRRCRTSARLQWLDAIEAWISNGSLALLLQSAPHGLEVGMLERLCGTDMHSRFSAALPLIIDAGAERFAFDRTRWETLLDQAVTTLSGFHAQWPDEPGLDTNRWHRNTAADLPIKLWYAAIEELMTRGRVRRQGYWYSLPHHSATLSETDQALAQRLQPMIAAGGFDPPWVRELAAVAGVEESDARKVLRKLVTQGSLYQVVPDLFYDRGCIDRLAAIARRIVQEHGAVRASGYRDAVGLGRKRAIQILEFFDRIGYMRRLRDSHVVRSDWRSTNVSW